MPPDHPQDCHRARDRDRPDRAPGVRRVEPHELGARKGDWERLQDALRREWGFEQLRVDLQALRRLDPALKSGKQRITVVVWNDAEVIDVLPGYHEGLYGPGG